MFRHLTRLNVRLCLVLGVAANLVVLILPSFSWAEREKVFSFVLTKESPVVTFYVVSNGIGEIAKLDVESISAKETRGEDYPHRAVMRVFDPDENLVHWSFSEQLISGSNDLQKYPLEKILIENVIEDLSAMPLSQKGVYQIRVSSNGQQTTRVSLYLPEGMGHGFSFQNGVFSMPRCMSGDNSCGTDKAESLWAWVPAHPEALLYLQLTPKSGSALPHIRKSETLLNPESFLNSNSEETDVRRFKIALSANDVMGGELWNFDFSQLSGKSKFIASGIPLILCNSKNAANKIRASVERVERGPYKGALVAHKFQVKIANLMDAILQHDKVGSHAELFKRSNATGEEIGTYPTHRKACFSPVNPDDVYRNLDLLSHWDGGLRMVRWALGSWPPDSHQGKPIQDVGSDSFWAGTIGTPFMQTHSPEHRWDIFSPKRYSPSMGFSELSGLIPEAGLSPVTKIPGYMGLFAQWFHPCNPWGPKKPGGPITHPELVYRGVAAALADAMVIAEDETFYGTADEIPYPGDMAFALGWRMEAFRWLAPLAEKVMTEPAPGGKTSLGKAVRDVWAEGMRRIVDRTYADYIVSSMNQSSHSLLAYEQFFLGTKGQKYSQTYGQLARRFARRYAAEVSCSGWAQESLGPDASYAGMQHWYLGRYVRMTQEDELGEDLIAKRALQKSYRFFNHTLGVEPDGRRIAGFNMSHRTGVGFDGEQYGGARGVAESIPDVAVWNRLQFPRDGTALANGRKLLKNRATQFKYSNNLSINKNAESKKVHEQGMLGAAEVARFLDSNRRAPSAVLPAQEPAYFTRFEEFNGELLAVRRPGYYVAIYTGQPHPSIDQSYIGGGSNGAWSQLRNPDYSPNQGLLKENIENKHVLAPLVGGGITVLSSEDYGTSIVSTNWSPLVHHGLVAKSGLQDDSRLYWEDYFEVTHNHDGPDRECKKKMREHDNGNSKKLPNGFSLYGRIEETSICYARHYTFSNNHIAVFLQLLKVKEIEPSMPPLGKDTPPRSSQTRKTFKRLFENIPLAICNKEDCARNRKSEKVEIVVNVSQNLTGKSCNKQLTTQVTTAHLKYGKSKDGKDREMIIEFCKAKDVKANLNDFKYAYHSHTFEEQLEGDLELQIGRLEVEITEAELRHAQEIDDPYELNYVIYPSGKKFEDPLPIS